MQKNKVRKIISFVAAIAIVASNAGMIPAVKGIMPAFGIEASAEALEPLSGTCGKTESDNVSWELTDADEDGEYDTLTISGTGAMADYTNSNPAWYDYREDIKTISISEGVTAIGDSAFYNCSALASVTFAENSVLETIGNEAFNCCEKLTSIELPASVKTIGNKAFDSCSILASVTFAENSVLETIGNSAFHNCENLTSIALPASVKTIGAEAFDSCSILASVTFAENSVLDTIGIWAFYNCENLTSIALPASVKTIDYGAFDGCEKLTDIYFGGFGQQWNNVSVGEDAIPNGCTVTCAKLKDLTGSCGATENDNVTYTITDSDEDGKYDTLAISGTGAMADSDYYEGDFAAWYDYREDISTVSISEGVTSIGAFAFCGCTAINSIEISASVKTIKSNAFIYCSSLASVTFAENSVLETIGESAFDECASLESIEIPASVKTIGDFTFSNCTSLTSVTFAENSVLSTIGEAAFYNCTKLGSIALHASVTEIKEAAFDQCDNLTDIYFDGSKAQWSKVIVSAGAIPDGCTINYAVSGLEALTGSCGATENDNVTYTLTDSDEDGKYDTLAISGTGAMADYNDSYPAWYDYHEDISTVSISEGVTSIGNQAFYGCSALASVTFAENSVLETIGNYAFKECSVLTSIELPASVNTIGDSAFYHCTSLSSVAFAENSVLETIVYSAFEGCVALTSIEIPASVNTIGDTAFYNCSSLSSVTFAENSVLETIGNFAFSGCSALSSVEIPASVETIGDYAFDGCDSLKNIYFGGYKKQWEAVSVGEGAIPNGCTVTCAELKDLTGSCGKTDSDKVTYTITDSDEDGKYDTLAISGTGAMEDYPEDNPAWYDYREDIKTVSISEGVTSIGEGAFYNCDSLSSVTFAENSALETIGDSAFVFTTLSSIELPASVETIGGCAFYRCKDLSSVTFAENSVLETIGGAAFCECVNLTSIDLPASVKTIGESAFEDCEKLTDIFFGGTGKQWEAVSVGDNAVPNGCTVTCAKLKDLTGSCGKTENDDVTWTLSDSDEDGEYDTLTISGTGAMADYTNSNPAWYAYRENIRTVCISGNVTSIGHKAFYNYTALNNVIFAEDSMIKTIGANTFSGCTALRSVTFAENSVLEEIGINAFNECSSLESIEIPAAVKTIYNYAFNSCKALASVTFAGNSGLKSIENYAFNDCTSLVSVELPASVKELDSSAFYLCSSLKKVTFAENSKLETIGDYVFSECGSLESIEIPASVRTIGDSAFGYCRGLTSVTFAENSALEKIESNAFCNCVLLKSIVIPASVKTIGSGAFSFCKGLTSVTFAENSALEKIESNAFYTCVLLKSIVIPASVVTIQDYAFRYCEALEDVTFEENSELETIGCGAFCDCTKLSGINYGGIWEKVDIGESAIPENCTVYLRTGYCGKTNEDDVTWTLSDSDEDGIYDTLTFSGTGAVNDYSFDNPAWSIYYESIKTVIISEGVTGLGENAFFGFTALEEVIFAENSTLETIGPGVFTFCGNLGPVKIPASVKFIGQGAFSTCSKLSSVTFEENSQLQTISDSAFASTPIKSIVIPASVTEIEKQSFYNCYYLTDLYYFGTKEQWEAYNFGDDDVPEACTIHYVVPFGAPTLTAEAGLNSAVLSWNEVYGAAKYAVTLSDGETTKLLSNKITATEFTVSNLEAGKTYSFTVRAYNGRKWSAVSNEVTAQPYTNVPTVEAAAGDRSVTLTWNEVSGAVKYAVTLIDGETKTVLSNKITAAKFVHKGLEANREYTYVVQSFNGKKWSAASEEVTAVPYSSVPVVEAVSGNRSVTLTWNEVPGAVKYAVTLIDGETKTVLNNKVTAAKYVQKGLEANRLYTYIVQSYNGRKWSPASEKVYAVPYSTVPVIISGGAQGTTVDIWWNPVPVATKYAVSEKIGDELILISNKITATNFTLKNIEDPESHVYVVQSYNGKKWSAASEPIIPCYYS